MNFAKIKIYTWGSIIFNWSFGREIQYERGIASISDIDIHNGGARVCVLITPPPHSAPAKRPFSGRLVDRPDLRPDCGGGGGGQGYYLVTVIPKCLSPNDSTVVSWCSQFPCLSVCVVGPRDPFRRAQPKGSICLLHESKQILPFGFAVQLCRVKNSPDQKWGITCSLILHIFCIYIYTIPCWESKQIFQSNTIWYNIYHVSLPRKRGALTSRWFNAGSAPENCEF